MAATKTIGELLKKFSKCRKGFVFGKIPIYEPGLEELVLKRTRDKVGIV